MQLAIDGANGWMRVRSWKGRGRRGTRWEWKRKKLGEPKERETKGRAGEWHEWEGVTGEGRGMANHLSRVSRFVRREISRSFKFDVNGRRWQAQLSCSWLFLAWHFHRRLPAKKPVGYHAFPCSSASCCPPWWSVETAPMRFRWPDPI